MLSERLASRALLASEERAKQAIENGIFDEEMMSTFDENAVEGVDGGFGDGEDIADYEFNESDDDVTQYTEGQVEITAANSKRLFGQLEKELCSAMNADNLPIYHAFENNVQTEESISDILLEAKQIIKNTYKEIDDEDEGVDADIIDSKENVSAEVQIKGKDTNTGKRTRLSKSKRAKKSASMEKYLGQEIEALEHLERKRKSMINRSKSSHVSSRILKASSNKATFNKASVNNASVNNTSVNKTSFSKASFTQQNETMKRLTKGSPRVGKLTRKQPSRRASTVAVTGVKLSIAAAKSTVGEKRANSAVTGTENVAELVRRMRNRHFGSEDKRQATAEKLRRMKAMATVDRLVSPRDARLFVALLRKINMRSLTPVETYFKQLVKKEVLNVPEDMRNKDTAIREKHVLSKLVDLVEIELVLIYNKDVDGEFFNDVANQVFSTDYNLLKQENSRGQHFSTLVHPELMKPNSGKKVSFA